MIFQMFGILLMFQGAKGNRVRMEIQHKSKSVLPANLITGTYESFSDVGEIRVWWGADFQSGFRVLKKVF